jgi:CheY-like chemotaxis protein
MSVEPPTLAGKRVLIVEDEAFVALLIEDTLIEFGCIPVGPYSSVAKVLEAVGSKPFDLALLDVILNGEEVYPVAYELAVRDIPFLFLSDYGDIPLPPGLSGRRICAKPFKVNDLAVMLSAVMLDPRGSGTEIE